MRFHNPVFIGKNKDYNYRERDRGTLRMDKITLITGSADETEEVGLLLGAGLERGMFVGLSGELGGGKTTLTRGIARGMGIRADVTSPTFQLVREYNGRERLYHFDFFRLASGCDLLDLDIAGCLEKGIVVAEWAEKFDVVDAVRFIRIRFGWEGENRRRIEFTGGSPEGCLLLDSLARDIERYKFDGTA